MDRYPDSASQILSRPAATILLLIIILLIASIARLSDMRAKSGIYHDESISYLIAGCQIRDLGAFGLTVAPTRAGDWQGLYEVDRPFCFGEIAEASHLSDVHPPFYYWLLNVWSYLTGLHLWTGPLLNLFIALITTIVLFFAAQDLLGNAWEALFVTALYAFLAPVVHVSAEARQYQLLSLWALLAVWLTIRLTRPTTKYSLAESLLLAMVIAAGALTHYQFFIVVSGAALFATLKLVRHNNKRLAALLGTLLAGYLLAFALFPMVDNALTRAGVNQSGFDPSLLGVRYSRLKMAAVQFEVLWYGLAICLVALIAGAIVLLLNGGRKKLTDHVRQTNWRGVDVLFFFVWLVAGVVFLYVTFFSPKHAMGPKYFALALPLIGFVPVFFLRLLRHPSVLVLYFPLVALFFLAGDIQSNVVSPRYQLEQHWDADEMVLVDTRARGIMPQIMWHLDPEQRVIVGSQEFLIDNFAEVETHLGQHFVYISENSAGNSEGKRQQLLDHFRQRGQLIEEVGAIPIRSGIARPVATIYVIGAGETE